MYSGPILLGLDNAFELSKHAKRFLKANMMWRVYTTSPEKDREKHPELFDVQEAAVARLCSMVSPTDRTIGDFLTAKALVLPLSGFLSHSKQTLTEPTFSPFVLELECLSGAAALFKFEPDRLGSSSLPLQAVIKFRK